MLSSACVLVTRTVFSIHILLEFFSVSRHLQSRWEALACWGMGQGSSWTRELVLQRNLMKVIKSKTQLAFVDNSKQALTDCEQSIDTV